MYHGMGLQTVTLKPGIKNEEILPAVSLKHLITVLKYVNIIFVVKDAIKLIFKEVLYSNF